MTGIILHHYPQSPVTEKVRVAFGMKGLSWASVEVPRLPPRPDLFPMTGGYRRVPVMQIGADIYCDSQCILRELERRFPEPSLFPPGGAGMPWGVMRWMDTDVFDLAIRIVLGADPAALPPNFAKDRGRLYLGPDFDLNKVNAELPHILSQLRPQLGWIDQRLATGRDFILGERAGMPDIAVYYIVWFLRGRWQGGPALLSEFPALEAWEARIRAIGHGTMTEMSAGAALDVARETEPEAPLPSDPKDPQRLTKGMRVTVVPDADSGDPEVEGTIVSAGLETLTLADTDPRVGTVHIHFPRVGYRVRPLDEDATGGGYLGT